MIDECLMVEELDQRDHAAELEVAQFTLSRFLSISPASSGTGGESPESQAAPGTQPPRLNISPTQRCWGWVFGGPAVEGMNHRGKSGPPFA